MQVVPGIFVTQHSGEGKAHDASEAGLSARTDWLDPSQHRLAPVDDRPALTARDVDAKVRAVAALSRTVGHCRGEGERVSTDP